MRRTVKGALSVILIITVLFSLLSLASCNRRYDEEEVLNSAKKLLKTAEMLNIVYFGSGIKYYDTEDSIGYYCKADAAHLEELGFNTVEELKKITDETFTKRYTSSINETVLSALRDDYTVVSNARYYQAYDENTGAPTCIMVHSKYMPLFTDKVEYNYDSMKVLGSKKEKVNLSVEVTVTNLDGASQMQTVTVTLVEEENGWRIDNSTYTNYNSLLGRYDELKDKDLK